MASSTVYRSALFVDFDNVFISLEEHSKQAADNFGSQPMRWLSWLEKSLPAHVGWESTRRRILSRRVYLNPRQFGRFRSSFVRSAFETVDTPALTSTGKTSADIHMVLDIMELLEHPTPFDEFIILSADADFAPVLIKLRKWDRRTTIMAVGDASPSYLASGDLVLKRSDFLAVLLEEGGVEPIERRRALSPTERADIKQCEDLILRHVQSAAGPVFMSVLAKHVRDAFPRIASDWSGYPSFKDFLAALALPGLATSNIAPGFVYDPSRHEHPDAQTGTFDRGEAFRQQHPLLDPVARKVNRQTDTPYLLPDQYATVFKLIADVINESGYNLTTVSKSVRDRCNDLNLAISRQQISFILRGIVFADHLLGQQAEDPIDLASHFLQNTYALCESSQLILSADEREAVALWLTRGNPIAEPLNLPPLAVESPPARTLQDPQGGPPIFVRVDEARLATYSQWVRDYIAKSDSAVPMATLATEMHGLFPELRQDWGGCKTLKLLLRQLELGGLELSSESPGFIFDPARHKLPSQQPAGPQAASAREIEFRREYPHLYEVAQRLRSSIGMPYLLPEEYACVFVETAREINTAGFDLSETSKRVRDRCRSETTSIARHPINIILRWIMFADHPLGQQPETPDQLARHMFENMEVQSKEKGITLSADEKELVWQWLTLALPDHFEIETRQAKDEATVQFGAGIVDEDTSAEIETTEADDVEHVDPIVADGLSVEIDHADDLTQVEDLGLYQVGESQVEPPVELELTAPVDSDLFAEPPNEPCELATDGQKESEEAPVAEPFPGLLENVDSASGQQSVEPLPTADVDIQSPEQPSSTAVPEASSETVLTPPSADSGPTNHEQLINEIMSPSTERSSPTDIPHQQQVEGPMEMLTDVGPPVLPELPTGDIFESEDSLPGLPGEFEITSADPSDTSVGSTAGLIPEGEPPADDTDDSFIFEPPPSTDEDTIVHSDSLSDPASEDPACEVTHTETISTGDSGLIGPLDADAVDPSEEEDGQNEDPS